MRGSKLGEIFVSKIARPRN